MSRRRADWINATCQRDLYPLAFLIREMGYYSPRTVPADISQRLWKVREELLAETPLPKES